MKANKKHPKKFLATKNKRIQPKKMDEKAKNQPLVREIWMKKPNLDENDIESYFAAKTWMNIEIFSFIVISYVSNLASDKK